MLLLVKKKGWTPSFYRPLQGDVVTADHITRFLGAHIGRMLRGFPSVRRSWLTRESYDAIPAAKEAMPQGAYEDIFRSLHFIDDWDDDDWEDGNDDLFPVEEGTAKHRRKHGSLEEAH